MKTIIFTTPLVGAALADQPARLHRRQQLIELPNPKQTSLPKACRDAAEAVISAMPPEPTQVSVFSSAYYETATRTATGDDRECAWVTEIPEVLYTEILEHSLEFMEWAREDGNGELLQDTADECGGTEAGYGLNASDTCQDEWDALGDMMMEGELLVSQSCRQGTLWGQ